MSMITDNSTRILKTRLNDRLCIDHQFFSCSINKPDNIRRMIKNPNQYALMNDGAY